MKQQNYLAPGRSFQRVAYKAPLQETGAEPPQRPPTSSPPRPVPQGHLMLFAHQALVPFNLTDLFSDYLITLGFYPKET